MYTVPRTTLIRLDALLAELNVSRFVSWRWRSLTKFCRVSALALKAIIHDELQQAMDYQAELKQTLPDIEVVLNAVDHKNLLSFFRLSLEIMDAFINGQRDASEYINELELVMGVAAQEALQKRYICQAVNRLSISFMDLHFYYRSVHRETQSMSLN